MKRHRPGGGGGGGGGIKSYDSSRSCHTNNNHLTTTTTTTTDVSSVPYGSTNHYVYTNTNDLRSGNNNDCDVQISDAAHAADAVVATAAGAGTTTTTDEFMESLLNPNFEELARQYPYFRHVFYHNNNNNDDDHNDDIGNCNTGTSSRTHNDNNDMDVDEHHHNTETVAVTNNATTTTTNLRWFTPEMTWALSRALLQTHFGISLFVQKQQEHPSDGEPNENDIAADAAAQVVKAVVDNSNPYCHRHHTTSITGSRRDKRISYHDQQHHPSQSSPHQLQHHVSSPSPVVRFLCPPIPNRFYYVQWLVETVVPLRTNPMYFYVATNDGDIHHLFDSQLQSDNNNNNNNSTNDIYGLDIGTGATCIYPLLCSYFNKSNGRVGERQPRTIFMHATDIVIDAVRFAQFNVQQNRLQSYIVVHLVPKSFRQQEQQPHVEEVEEESGRLTITSKNGNNHLHHHHHHDPISIENEDDNHVEINDHNPRYTNQSVGQHQSTHQQQPGPLLQSLQHIFCSNTTPHPSTKHQLHPPQQTFDFVMTNPPFYDTIHGTNTTTSATTGAMNTTTASDDDHVTTENDHHNTTTTMAVQQYGTKFPQQQQQRKQNLRRRTTGMTINEGYYPHGEIGFGIDLILDSWNLYTTQTVDHHHDPLQQQQPSNVGVQQPQVPHWISMMCGKKSTFTYLYHVLYQLLGGPGHICTTQFGPGHHTRWFLAWTFQQPNIRTPLAKNRTKHCWSFTVTTSSLNEGPRSSTATTFSALQQQQQQQQQDTNSKPPCQEVADRLMQYCCTFPTSAIIDNGVEQHALVCEVLPIPVTDTDMDTLHRRTTLRHNTSQHPTMQLQMYEKDNANNKPSSASWLGDETIPDCIQQCLLTSTDPSFQRTNLLPLNGRHYLLDITLFNGTNRTKPTMYNTAAAISNNKNNDTPNNNHNNVVPAVVHVQIDGYCHSLHGQQRIDKIKLQLQPDICRTSRRWRRISSNLQQQQQQRSKYSTSGDKKSSMDVSN